MSVLEHYDEVYPLGSQHRLMLESLILPAPRDRESFNRWLADVDFEALDFFTLRLVPALFRKFGGSMPEFPFRGRMKGVYRYYHFRGGLLLAAGRSVIERMVERGVDFILFKGIAIALKYHQNIATRPMSDMDVLVRRESVPKAETILRECGYQYAYAEAKKATDIHSHDYASTSSGGFDLHWYSLFESPRQGIDDGIWERAEFFDWDGLVVKVMSPEDLLVTSIVNGVRDDPIHPHWIHDVATIIDSEPVILWETVWEEAGKRDLREQVFNALSLVREIEGKAAPSDFLHALEKNDLEFCRDLLKSGTSDDTNLLSANAPVSPRHIRYFLDENKAITGLFLQWRHLPLIAELFEVGDRQKLNDLVSNHPAQGGGHLVVPAGLLAKKPRPVLPAYGARIAVVDMPPKLILSPGEIAEITVEVENNTSCCWPVCAGSGAVFGLTYHLLAEDGTLLVRDHPRVYLAIARQNYVAFIEPSQKLACKLKVFAPKDPGRYVVQLDIVHENVLWFSDRGGQFQRIDLEVPHSKAARHFAVNGSNIFHETMDDETVIIDAAKGSYYTANGYASLIWNAIAGGHGVEVIVSAFAAAAVFREDRNAVQRFIESLLAERLIVPSGAEGTGPRDDFRVEARFGTQVPVLTRHPESSELIKIHPVRRVAAQAGWPHALEASRPAEVSASKG